MSLITAESSELVTLINVFEVADPAAQDALIASLQEVTETVMRHMPGFVSANVHRGRDGCHVVNYAQWQNMSTFQAMLTDRRVAEHLNEVSKISQSIMPVLYDVAYVSEGKKD